MEYISSDTNLWLDYLYIDELSLPFLLPFRYLMYSEDVDGELLYPPGLKEKLLSQGLIPTEL